jgi:hypothetical protein
MEGINFGNKPVDEILDQIELLFNCSSYEIFKNIIDFINNCTSLFINKLKENGINSKEEFNEFYPSVEKILIEFVTFFNNLIRKEDFFNQQKSKSEESNPEENKPLLSGSLSREEKLNWKDILFLRFRYICALLFNHFCFDFKLDEDISCETLYWMFQNTINELRNLSSVKVLPKMSITISVNDQKKSFFFK